MAPALCTALIINHPYRWWVQGLSLGLEELGLGDSVDLLTATTMGQHLPALCMAVVPVLAVLSGSCQGSPCTLGWTMDAPLCAMHQSVLSAECCSLP